jgi:hypothetical protein
MKSKVGLLIFLAIEGAFAQVREKRVVPFPDRDRLAFQAQRRASVAVVVGVGKYPRFSGFDELRYPVADVERLADELEKKNYVVIRLEDGDASRQTVLNAIERSGPAAARYGGA